MIKLLRFFSLTSLLAFVVGTALLTSYYHQSAVSDLIKLEESKNVALTQAFANSLWPEFAPFVASTPGLSVDDLQSHPESDRLLQAVMKQMMDLTVVKVKVYNLEGLTVFSTDASQIGADQSANAGFLSARSGIAASELTHRDTFSAFDGMLEDRDVLSSYIPIRSGGPAGPVEGVFELYSDVTPLMQQVEAAQTRVVAVVVIILGALYIFLLAVIRHADKIIQRHQANRAQVEEQLRVAQHGLQQQVVERTAELTAANEQLRSEISRRRRLADQREHLLEVEREQRRLAETLAQVSVALNSSPQLTELLDLICRESMSLFDVDAAFIWLVQGEQLVGIAGYGQGRDSFIGKQIPLSDTKALGPRVIREQRPIYVNDAENSREVSRRLIDIFQVKAILGVPLMIGERATGALMIIDTQQAQRYRPSDLQRAVALGSGAAVAIERGKLLDSLHQSNDELAQAYDQTLEGWVRALELRNKETEGHSQRVTELTMQLARNIGLVGEELVHIRRGALLHDIGKMGIPDEILLKPGPLTQSEWRIMRNHPVYAYEMLSSVTHLRPALDIPYAHHEKWDGSGYPRGLKGERIPLAARIFAVVDVWDALCSDRPYRPAWPQPKALEYIREQSGLHFDPLVVEAFFGLIEKELSPELILQTA